MINGHENRREAWKDAKNIVKTCKFDTTYQKDPHLSLSLYDGSEERWNVRFCAYKKIWYILVLM